MDEVWDRYSVHVWWHVTAAAAVRCHQTFLCQNLITPSAIYQYSIPGIWADAYSAHCGRGRMTRRTTELITMLLLPLSILMVGYALFVYHFRTKFLIKKQVTI